MTAKPDLAAQIAELRRVLAEATKECPKSCTLVGSKHKRIGQNWDSGSLIEYDAGLCDGCQGSGRVARFPGFRQECRKDDICSVAGCWCQEQAWQVAVGGLEHGLAGLTKSGLHMWDIRFRGWILRLPSDIPTVPSADEILAEGLRLVCLIAEFIRPCLRHGGGEWAGGPICSECEELDGYVVEIAGLEVPID